MIMNEMRKLIEERVFAHRDYFQPEIVEVLLDTTDGVVSPLSLGAIHTLANMLTLEDEATKRLIGMLDDLLLLNFYIYCERLRAVREVESSHADNEEER